jgi:hypothetical protein
MAYNHPQPLAKGEYYVSYPHLAMQFVENEKRFKEYLKAYLKNNEPTSVAVGITEDLKLVCKENPDNTREMVQIRRANRKAKGSKKE